MLFRYLINKISFTVQLEDKSRSSIKEAGMHIFEGIKIKGVDKDGQEKEFSLSELGEKIVLYFYPKDNTPVCTQEAKNFRDKLNALSQKATVIGVSPDSVESHKNFRMNHDINFPLLSDPDNKLAHMLGISREKQEHGHKYMSLDRSTFIVKNGLITKAWRNVNVDGHVDDVINSL